MRAGCPLGAPERGATHARRPPFPCSQAACVFFLFGGACLKHTPRLLSTKTRELENHASHQGCFPGKTFLGVSAQTEPLLAPYTGI